MKLFGNKGWRNEPLRHSLARKGVKTTNSLEKMRLESRERARQDRLKQEVYEKNALLKLKKGDNVLFVGRKWFDKINGNTYHTTEVYVNGGFVGKSKTNYGYGDQYKQTGIEVLEEKGYIKKPDHNKNQSSLRTMGLKYDYGINVNTSVSDVSRRKDL